MSIAPTEDVDALRARVAELEAELRQQEHATGPPGSRASRGSRGSRWRSFAATVLIVTACVLAPLSVASVWASTVVSDTDRYVETVAPVAADPGVQAALTDAVTTAIEERLDISSLTSETLTSISQLGNLPPRVAATLPALTVPLTRGIESFIHDQVANLVASSQFQQLWDQANRLAHSQVVKLLEGNQGGAVSAQDDTITLNLAPIIAEVKQRLVDQGFSLASNIPAIDKSFVLVQSGGIAKAQHVYKLLNALGLWLPFITLGCLAAGVMLSRDRRSALLRGSLGIVFAMVALGVVLALTRTLYVETTPADVLTSQSAGNVFDDLVRFLRSGLRTVGVAFLVVAVAAFLSGPSAAAVGTRRGLTRGIASLRGGAEAAGLRTGRLGPFVYRHKRGLRLGAFLAAGTVLMVWSRPTVSTVVGATVAVVVALVLIEFLAQPPPTDEDAPATFGAQDEQSSGAGEAKAPVGP